MSWQLTDQHVTLRCSGLCGEVEWLDRAGVPEGLWPEVVQAELLAKALDREWGGELDGDIHLCPGCGDWDVDAGGGGVS